MKEKREDKERCTIFYLFYSLNFFRDFYDNMFIGSLSPSICVLSQLQHLFHFLFSLLFSFLYSLVNYSSLFFFQKKKEFGREPDLWNNSNRIWISFSITIFVCSFLFSLFFIPDSLINYSSFFFFQKKGVTEETIWMEQFQQNLDLFPNYNICLFFSFLFSLFSLSSSLLFINLLEIGSKRNLQNAQLNGTIPTELGQLTNLTYLYLFSFFFSFFLSFFWLLSLFFIFQKDVWCKFFNWENSQQKIFQLNHLITLYFFFFFLFLPFSFSLSLPFLHLIFFLIWLNSSCSSLLFPPSFSSFRSGSYNHLNGTIPSEIGKLSQLQFLFLISLLILSFFLFFFFCFFFYFSEFIVV